LDLTPLPRPMAAPTAAPSSASSSAPSSASLRSAKVPAAPAPNPPSNTNATAENPIGGPYHSLEADALRRAPALAAPAHVKALEALRDEVIRRDAQLGNKQDEMISHLLDEIDRYTDQARTLRLKLDSLLFRKEQVSSERKPG